MYRYFVQVITSSAPSSLTGAKKAREVVFSVLCDACADGDLSIPEAIEAAKDIFSQNAIQFYKINYSVKSSGSENRVSPNFVKVNGNDSEDDVLFVRVIWSDASGQQRCRVSFFPFGLSFKIDEYFCFYILVRECKDTHTHTHIYSRMARYPYSRAL